MCHYEQEMLCQDTREYQPLTHLQALYCFKILYNAIQYQFL